MIKTKILFPFEIGFFIFTLVFFSVVFNTRPLTANPGTQQGLIPSALLLWPDNGPSHVVLVDKSEQKVYVYNRYNLYSPEKVFHCSTGENSGPKTKQDDKKTPEGIYFFIKSYLEQDLAPIYGVRAFPINYPNVIDQKEGKYGYGIWFHGLNKPLRPRDTNGCIALDNGDIEELSSYVRLHETPVIISYRVDMVHVEELERKRRTLEMTIEEWRTAWEEEDIEKYISFYHKEFWSSQMNRMEWKEYKTALAKRYHRIQVRIEDLNLFANNGLVLASFKQKYQGDGFESIGEKNLYFKQNSAQWRIFGEFFKEQSRKIEPVKVAAVSTLDEVNAFISLWRIAWEQQDLDVYMSCYNKDFESRGMDIEAWRQYKKDLNDKYESITIKIQDIEIEKRSETQAQVFFTQDFRADEYQDFGLKRMDLVKEGDAWKIKNEIWTPLKKTSNQ
ncbi:MAG: L,D-transpeptidase family protein [Deltaproteobacteria bacterium]|nr:L,D-transpeptidase family protein [Deltaproteobacteria bacterium]